MAKDDAALGDEELHSAINVLRELVPEEALNRLQPSSPNTVYTTLVTLWMLTLQRLGCGKTLAGVVRDVLSHNRQLLPPNKRVQEGTLSLSSAAYSNARQRLTLETVEYFANRVSHSIIESSPPCWFADRRAFILDGTTITLQPTPELQRAFPPATNQHGESVWPVALLLVAHELQTGCAMVPEMGAMYGENNTSEAELAKALARRLPRGSLVLADSGFGIFGVAHSVVQGGCPILFRMTRSRFKTVRRQATLIEDFHGHRTYEARWTPSVKDRKSHPELPGDAALDVFLHEVPLENGETLLLVTTLPISNAQAGEYYARRYDVEHDIRDIKVTLDTENIRAQSVDMVQKELLTSMVAYNLVVQFRRQAAKLANLPPRRLSFTNVLNTFGSFLLKQDPGDAETWIERFEQALRLSAKHDKLPNRSKRRHPPRRAHPRRPKSTKFMKSQNSPKPEKPPLEKPK
jgi:Transposase DDE domain